MIRSVLVVAGCFCTAAATFSQTPADTSVMLQQVDVRGIRFSGLHTGEIKQLDVDNNLSSLTGTAAEAFRQLPSVVTDMEGGIFFRGSGRSALLLNGVPYGLLEEYNGDVLIQLPALFFNRISVSSYPPVNQLPDGDAGLFNLESPPLAPEDAPVTVTLGAGWNERYNAGTALNFHPGKWHIRAKYNYRREYRFRSFFKSTATDAGTTEMENTAVARPDVHVADLYAGYDITRRDILSVYTLYYMMDYSRVGRIGNTRYNPAGEAVNRMLRIRDNNQRQEAYAAEARWNHTFARPDEHLEVIFNYNNFVYDEDNDYRNENPQTGAVMAEDNLYISRQKDNHYLSAAYQRPVGGTARLHAGYIGRYRKERDDTEGNDLKDGVWIPNVSKSNRFAFNRLTNLFFLSVTKEWERFTGELGVQAEHSRQEAAGSVHTGFRLYPRLRLAYRTGEDGELRLAWQQRVIRPYGADLNPFTDRSDATHIRQGNPELKDETIHSAELAWQFHTGRAGITPAIYYRHRTGRLMETVRETDGIAVWEKANMGSSRTAGLEVSVNWSPFSFLAAGLSADVYRDEIDGRVAGYGEKKAMACWGAKGFLHFRLTPAAELQIDGFALSAQLTPQGKIEERSGVNIGLSHYFMRRKLRVGFSVNNLFDSLEEVTVIASDAMRMRQVRSRDPRVAWLTSTWHF